MKYATWNVKGINHKAEEMESVLNEKHIKIAVITHSRKTFRGTMETDN